MVTADLSNPLVNGVGLPAYFFSNLSNSKLNFLSFFDLKKASSSCSSAGIKVSGT